MTKVANPFAMKLRGFTPGGPVWRHVRSSAQHHQVQFPSTRQPVFCWLLLLKCQFAAGQLKATNKGQETPSIAEKDVRERHGVKKEHDGLGNSITRAQSHQEDESASYQDVNIISYEI